MDGIRLQGSNSWTVVIAHLGVRGLSNNVIDRLSISNEVQTHEQSISKSLNLASESRQ